MSSSFAYSFDQYGGDSPFATETHSFDDGYFAPDFSNVNPTVSGGEFISYPAYFSSETSPILPPPAVMEHHEGFALREWRRQNTIRLEEKEKREKELLSQIIVQADKYKVEFHIKRQARCESIKVVNREKEQAFVAIQEKFHGEANKDYWKSIAEMIPKEVPAIEKRKFKKEQGKKASTVVVQGPKPGKPTDLSRMRQILLMLKHNTPPHLNLSPTPPDENTSAAVA